jgi:hypothetical protein
VNRHVSFRAWRGDELGAGTHVGTVAGPGGLAYAETAGCRHFADPALDGTARDYTWTSWLSPAVSPGHPFTALVPSWNARTPDGSWLEVEARTSEDGVHWSRWWVLGRWAETDAEIRPASVPGQDGPDARVGVDELLARGDTTWSAFQLRVTLLRPAASIATPTVGLVGAVVCSGTVTPTGDPGGAAHGIELDVPAYSQQLHRGEYPEWNAGGEAWCSPTSVAMVLGTWGLGPSPEDYAWVESDCPDPFVDHAVRHSFDHAYGAGNWSFNTAYAGLHGAEAFVTRLRSLAEAERFVAAGIPLVASVSFDAEELPGAGYATAGHLLVVVGFDAAGDVVCHDPASHERPSNDQVRVVYPRAAFETVWMRSGGLVYVIHPADVPLPPPAVPAEPNW